MSLAELLQWNLSLFLLILSRWAGMIMLAPVFGARGVPAVMRLGLALGITVVVYPLISAAGPVIPLELLPYFALVLKEGLVGLAIGFLIYTMTAVLVGAGQLIDLQMGFTIGSSIDPIYGVQTPMIGNFLMIFATMFLLATNSHHYLIAAMLKSYAYVPINPSGLPSSIAYYAQLAVNVFALAVQLAMPILGAVLVADVGVGLLMRAVPQINIFAIVFTIKITLGLLILYFSISFFGEAITYLFKTNMDWVLELYQGWQQ